MDPERMVSEALRAQAVQGRPPAPPTGSRRPAPPPRPFPVAWVLLIALLTGALVGVSLAMISIFVPGALPAVGAG
jgi:hypothetical protein